jgi:2-polyprenyl-3-methyl-5-hydroxy-6-metoxy-1,4-benzoquinol methylase
MVRTFYDRLAPFYHLLYSDWERSIGRQGAALSMLLRELGVLPGASVIDAACGIGTQAIGLAERGYRVRGSDISTVAVARAESEMARRGLAADFAVTDLRELAAVHAEPVSAVLACDNAVPHLLCDKQILAAFRSCFDRLLPGGALIISVRDYAGMVRRSPDVQAHAMHIDAGRRLLAVQAWEWDGDQYDVRLYLMEEHADGRCETQLLRSRFYAISVGRLLQLMREAGFVETERRDGVLFQPVLVGIRPSE